jgi:dissimilatory sulfite reductase (desulfoviridin) alpha/beta subunit
MAARFSSMRTVLGVGNYSEIMGRHGYREITDIPNLEKVGEVYRVLLEVFRERFGETMRTLGMEEYVKILRELRLKGNARLNPEQAVRVFNHMQETLNARE